MTTDEERLTVVNVVASTRVAEELDLPDIAIQLNCEYEPEQFPGVVYRVTEPKLAILMFRSGRAVCTGGKNEPLYVAWCNGLNSHEVRWHVSAIFRSPACN